MVFYTHMNGFIDMYEKLVFVRYYFGAPTVHYITVEKHPDTSESEAFMLIKYWVCILAVLERLVQQNFLCFRILAHIVVCRNGVD